MHPQNNYLVSSPFSMGFLPIVTLALITIQSTMAATSVTLYGVTDTLKPEYEKYAPALKEAENAFIEADNLFKDPGFETRTGWKKEGKHSAFSIHSKNTTDGKLTVVSTVLDGNIEDVMRETWGGIEALSSWNPQIAYADIVVPLTGNSDILCYGNNDILVITGREFLTSRIYRKTGDGYLMASRSVDLPERPEREKKVRAKVFLAASRFRPDPSNKRKTLCDVVMSADLRGNLPKELVAASMPTVMAMITEQNIKHFKELSKYN